MSRLGAGAIGLWLFGSVLAGCSLAGPSDHSFTPAVGDEGAPPSEKLVQKRESDATACRGIAKEKGVSSILAIVKSADRSNTDRDYIACMKKKGWKVEGEPDTSGAASSTADQLPPAPE